METKLYVALMFIGLGGAAAGAIGIILPPGERLTAILPLVLGAGVGIATLAIGYMAIGDESQDDLANTFLVASTLGLITVLVGLGLLWRRSQVRPAPEDLSLTA